MNIWGDPKTNYKLKQKNNDKIYLYYIVIMSIGDIIIINNLLPYYT